MNILIFILILCVLILIHELGHFLFAKLFGIRVEEFGIGYPPRALTLFSWKGTRFSLNWIPFGGFVRIFGDAEIAERELSPEEKKVALPYQAAWKQIIVMFGGILFNLLFAWILFTGIVMNGIETSVQSAPKGYEFNDEAKMMVTNVRKDSPAFASGLQVGDVVYEYYHSKDKLISAGDTSVEEFINFIGETKSAETVNLVVQRSTGTLDILTIEPERDGKKPLIGISIDKIAKIKLGFFDALVYGAKHTLALVKEITLSFWSLFTGQLSFDNVSGPVGIASQVGQIAKIGMTYLLSFAAILSINLAVLNFIPFPALDGGRILFILIESIIRKKIKPSITAWVNGIGFFALILLMLVITAKDIIRLF